HETFEHMPARHDDAPPMDAKTRPDDGERRLSARTPDVMHGRDCDCCLLDSVEPTPGVAELCVRVSEVPLPTRFASHVRILASACSTAPAAVRCATLAASQ